MLQGQYNIEMTIAGERKLYRYNFCDAYQQRLHILVQGQSWTYGCDAVSRPISLSWFDRRFTIYNCFDKYEGDID